MGCLKKAHEEAYAKAEQEGWEIDERLRAQRSATVEHFNLGRSAYCNYTGEMDTTYVDSWTEMWQQEEREERYADLDADERKKNEIADILLDYDLDSWEEAEQVWTELNTKSNIEDELTEEQLAELEASWTDPTYTDEEWEAMQKRNAQILESALEEMNYFHDNSAQF